MPQVWYDAADLAGLIYNNPLIEARLARYPAFLGLAERPEFQDMASDPQFTELLLRRAPIMKVLDQPKAQAITQNPDLLKLIWTTVVPDLKDLPDLPGDRQVAEVRSGEDPGRWNFNVNVAMSLLRRAKPNISSKEMQSWKRWMVAAFAKTSFVAMTDHQAILKNLPQLPGPPAAGVAPSAGPQTLKGQWTAALDGKYQLALSGGGKDESLTAKIDGDRLTIGVEGMELVFDRED